MVNPRVFFDVDVEGHRIGRIIMELFANECPVTVENFRALCTDYTRRDGTGGESIYGQPLQDESLKRKHDIEGLLSMANKGPNTSSSQFFITTRPTPHLDGKHVVFGRVVRGYDIVEKIESMPTDERDRPLSIIMISNCGELELRLPPHLQEKKKAQEAEQKKDEGTRGRRRNSSRSNSGSESDRDSKDSSDVSESESESDSSSDQERERKKSKSKKGSRSHRSGSRRRSSTRRRSSRESRHRRSSRRDRSRDRDNDRDQDRSERSSRRARRDSRSRSPDDRKASMRRSELDSAKKSSDHAEVERGRLDDKVHRETNSAREAQPSHSDGLPETDLRHSLNAAKESRQRAHDRSPSPEVKYKGRGRMKYRERRPRW
ncbi:hypothetical protein DFQ27_003626 [Actinomortierella ambigua]|uniref:peptidylprolyl isomerase n=1 Tax=Actinomortierella ambigua TaxID=1343610 RepID=A0A9P6Q6X9_9FUNG|nr:hypothetical protein DFQ27_003626 [Actinomortierella ambigua]